MKFPSMRPARTPQLAAVCLAALLAGCTSARRDDAGFTRLFDGKTLNGWRYVGNSPGGYQVRDGALVCESGVRGNLFTEKEYENFILRLEFKLDYAANNGIGIRSPLVTDVSRSGMEIQILEESGAFSGRIGRLRPEQLHGSLYDVFPARPGAMKTPGQWNAQEIRVDGRRIRVTLNGIVILDVDLGTVTSPEKLAKHPGLRRERGHIAILGHRDHVEFRNLFIKEL